MGDRRRHEYPGFAAVRRSHPCRDSRPKSYPTNVSTGSAGFAEILDEQLQELDKELLEQKMRTEEFVDLFEDGAFQAARSLTDERKEHIAALLKNSLSSEDLDHVQEKQLLFPPRAAQRRRTDHPQALRPWTWSHSEQMPSLRSTRRRFVARWQ